jgi:hydrogenase maturation protease
MNPVRVLQLIRSLGGQPGRLYLVGCEPAVLETEDGAMGLSQPVEAAIPKAVEMIDSLIRDLLSETSETIRAGAAAT